MYLKHFGMRSDPFRLDPNLDFIFVSKSHEETIAHLVYGLEQGENFVLITGAVGTGKTLALHFLIDQIVGTFRTVFINVTQLDFRELLKMILSDLEIPFDAQADRADLLVALKRHLKKVAERKEKVLVIVDEAQNLEVETLEGLRLLSNLTQPGPQVLQMVLAGQPGLDRVLATRKLEQLDQRIRVRYRLENLLPDEVGPYLAHRVAVAGGSPDLFTKGTHDLIFQESDGVPRLVNQAASKALLAAYVDEASKVKARHVERGVPEAEIDVPEEEVAIGGPGIAEPDPEPEPETPAPILKSKHPEAKRALAEVDLEEIGERRRRARSQQGSGHKSRQASSRQRRKPSSWWPPLKWVLISAGVVAVLVLALDMTGVLRRISAEGEATTDHVAADGGGASREATTESGENQSAQTAKQTDGSAARGGEYADPPPPVSAATGFALHVASFRDRDRAQRQAARFESDGFKSFLIDVDVGGTRWVRVCLGPFDDRDQAVRQGQLFKDQGIVDQFLIVPAANGEI